MATITLRIVGLYFKKAFEVDLSTQPTIKDILDQYITNNPISQVGGIAYEVNPEEPDNGAFRPGTMRKLSHNFEGGPGLSGHVREAGIYSLEEAEINLGNVETYLAWQYYVIDDATKRNISATTSPGGFESFQKFDRFEGNSTIIWRLVAIAAGPINESYNDHSA
jgi:hypothetical protein